MATITQLVSLGFRNPTGEEREDILRSFAHHSGLLNAAIAVNNNGNVDFEQIDENGGVTSIGTHGRICRFIRLSPDRVAFLYNNPTIPNGAKAVPRLRPAHCFTNNSVKLVQILYANNGYLVICLDEAEDTLLADDFLDPATLILNKERIKPDRSTPQHIPRPPNAFILYRNCKMGEVKLRYPELGNNDISKVIGKLWHAETQEIKIEFKTLASQQTAELLRLNPHYKYRPRRADEILRRPGLKRKKAVKSGGKARKA